MTRERTDHKVETRSPPSELPLEMYDAAFLASLADTYVRGVLRPLRDMGYEPINVWWPGGE